MFSSLATKLAMKKVGISSDTFNVSNLTGGAPDPPPPNKLKKSKTGVVEDEEEGNNNGWPKWMTVKNLPLTVQPWLSPPPPPIPVAECPKVGDLAPLDRDRKLTFGGGRRVVVVFLRCVGCAFAQKTFLALRTLANRHAGSLTCIAVSHSSPTATQKWIDLLGGAWNVQVVVDEDRALYAAWGLGLGNTWYLFNPTTQIQGWKEKGWLGQAVATSIERTSSWDTKKAAFEREQQQQRGAAAAAAAGGKTGKLGRENTGGAGVVRALPEEEGPSTVMGNKWQQAGAFAIDGRGTVVWGGKALRADDVMDLDMAIKVLGL